MKVSRTIKIYLFVVLLTILVLALVFGFFRYRRMHAYDELIAQISMNHDINPKLIRAIIWQESRFRYNCRGKHGEIGLMQVTEDAANEWASAHGLPKIRKDDLFIPETNIEAGTWYLKRSVNYWSNKANPLPYALAEYNAGRSNAVRWAASDGNDVNKFWDSITYPATKRYVRDILNRYRRGQ
jgi:soluble lytic murein transglycosylase